MIKKPILHDLLWIAPVSLVVGALLSLFDRGTWWIGWLAYSLIGFLGMLAVVSLWRWAGATRMLGLVLLLALILRLGLAVALTEILPVYGHGSEVDSAGYVFRDAYTRDDQAWNLASSSDSILKAFDKSYSSDQYGGLLFLDASIYRLLSPDHHRPWLVILFGLLVSVMGVAVVWQIASEMGGESLAKPATWIMALYPEAILLAASEMREPYLLTCISMSFWGMLDFRREKHLQAWLWMVGGVLGLLVFSPSMAVFALVGMIGWALLRGPHLRISWSTALITAGMTIAALILTGLELTRGSLSGRSLPVVLTSWLQSSASWDVYVIQSGSGWIQEVFLALPASLHMPFMVGYGVAQPVLPAALADPTAWPWKIIGILRATGWYLLIPFLVGSLRSIWKMSDHSGRRAWIWLWIITWVWITVSSYRAGGDQWDNPRYRVVFLLWQALLAGYAWEWWRTTHDLWQGRVLAVEGVFLMIFGYWYAARYSKWLAGQVHIFVIIVLIVIISSIILVGGWIWDRHRARRI